MADVSRKDDSALAHDAHVLKWAIFAYLRMVGWSRIWAVDSPRHAAPNLPKMESYNYQIGRSPRRVHQDDGDEGRWHRLRSWTFSLAR